MKPYRLFTMLLAACLLAVTLVGCSAAQTLDRVEDQVENRLDQAGEAVESMLQNATGAPKLTRKEAEATALRHAGLTAEAVTGLHSDYDVDDGVPQWEVDFHSGGWEYDYTIHAQTGQILHSDRERED